MNYSNTFLECMESFRQIEKMLKKSESVTPKEYGMMLQNKRGKKRGKK